MKTQNLESARKEEEGEKGFGKTINNEYTLVTVSIDPYGLKIKFKFKSWHPVLKNKDPIHSSPGTDEKVFRNSC